MARIVIQAGGHDTTAALTVDHHTPAAIALSGTAPTLVGGLYLAYDLFGGKHGPLRTLTRAVTILISDLPLSPERIVR
jgi:hypothetical protein